MLRALLTPRIGTRSCTLPKEFVRCGGLRSPGPKDDDRLGGFLPRASESEEFDRPGGRLGRESEDFDLPGGRLPGLPERLRLGGFFWL